MSYLLDADWAIEALAGKPHAVDPLNQISDQGIAISWVTIGEIYEGAFGFPDPATHLTTFRTFLQPLQKLNLNDSIMEHFAEIRSGLRRHGQIISDFDILLGATALHYNMIVLTFNTKHLGRIPNIKLYRPH